MDEDRIRELQDQIDALPGGSIAHKMIHGKLYYYHRTMINGKRHEKFVDEKEMPALKAKIEKRRELIAELKALLGKRPAAARVSRPQPAYAAASADTGTDAGAPAGKPSASPVREPAYAYKMSVRMGEDLARFAEPAKGMKKRACFKKLTDFLYGDADGRLLFLCGFRRTGKSTMLRQAVSDMDEEKLAKCACMLATPQDSIHDLDRDVRHLERAGVKYLFIDEITSMPDFKDACSLLADSYAASGMRIVLSGSSSLAFIICHDEALHDRALMLDTTHIPYKDCVEVLGAKDLDEYMRCGGTMDLGKEKEEGFVFATSASVDMYVNSAIQKNIQDGILFKLGGSAAVSDAESAEEAAGPVSSVVAQESRVFLKEILETEYKPGDLNFIPDNLLEILGAALHCDDVEMEHRSEIEGYLSRMDYLRSIDIVPADPEEEKTSRIITSQPGIRYTQVKDMVETFIQDDIFASIPALKRKNAQEKIMKQVSKHMQDDIILLETCFANPDKKVCSYKFPDGVYNIVIADTKEATCKIYVIKHSDKTSQKQTRLLVDDDMLKETERRFGKITERGVIYRGKSGYIGDIRYINAEDYLLGL